MLSTNNGSTRIAKCSRNTLRLLGLVIVLYTAFLAMGYYYHKPTKTTDMGGYNNWQSLEHFQESVDSTIDTVRRYRDVFNSPTTRGLDKEAQDIRRITAANQSTMDSELENLQKSVALLVQQMNANLYRQMQRNYRVANDAAIERSHTDLRDLPSRGI